MCCSYLRACWTEEGGGGGRLIRISIDPGYSQVAFTGGGGDPKNCMHYISLWYFFLRFLDDAIM